MEDKQLLKLSLITAIIGLISMLYLADALQLKLTNVEEININMLEKNVKVKGTIVSVKTMKTIQLLELEDLTGKIQVVIFDVAPKIKRGSYLEIEGKVSKYENNLQINADSIKEVN